MKNIVLDGDRIAEAIQKAKDKMINGEYDNNDLILRGDALKAIRQKCISEHLPFKSNTPVMVTTTACTVQLIVDIFSMVNGAVSLRVELAQKSSNGQNCRSPNPRR
nr:MAG TPA: hypothetical protein [Caudoviricetes sp.]